MGDRRLDSGRRGVGVARPPVRLLALGDSYTVGESVPAGSSWPRQLAARLTEAGTTVEATIIARTAWTSAELIDALDGASLPGEFDVISLQIGVNDQYRGLSVDGFVANTGALIERARQKRSPEPGGIFVVSIPDWGVTPHAEGRDRREIAAEIDRFNQALAELAAGAGLPMIDVTTSTRHHPGELTSDGLHPSGRQYRRWVDVIAPVVEAMVSAAPG